MLDDLVIDYGHRTPTIVSLLGDTYPSFDYVSLKNIMYLDDIMVVGNGKVLKNI